MTAFLASILARFAATKIGKLLPSWAWEIVIIALIVGAGALAHHVAVVHRDNQVRAEQKASDDKATEAQLAKLRAALTQKDAQLAAMSSQLRKANDEEHRNIDALGGSVLLRGPGAAACPRVSAAPAAPIRSQQASPETGPTVAPVPDTGGTELVALPFTPTVRAFQNGDECFADRRAIDAWYDNLVKAWPKQPAK